MNAKKIFNPKGWLILFAVLHTVMFLLPQLFATTTAAEMAWGEGNVPQYAEFYEFQMGTLGIAYTPMLLAMALMTTGVLRAKLALITALSMLVVAGLNTYMNIQQAGYMEDMPMAMMIGMPIFIFGGMLASALLHMKEETS